MRWLTGVCILSILMSGAAITLLQKQSGELSKLNEQTLKGIYGSDKKSDAFKLIRVLLDATLGERISVDPKDASKIDAFGPVENPCLRKFMVAVIKVRRNALEKEGRDWLEPEEKEFILKAAADAFECLEAFEKLEGK